MELKYQSGFKLTGVSDKESERVYGKAIPVGENRILLVDTEDRIQCFPTHDGKLLWSDIYNQESGREARHDEHIVYQNGIIYSRREDKDIVALDPVDGKILWKYYGRFNEETFQGHFRFYEDKIMIFHTNNSVFALDLRTGAVLWKQKVSGLMQNNSCSFIWKNYYIVQTQSKKRDRGYLVYIDAESGEVARTVKLGIPGCNGEVVMVHNSFAIHNDELWYKSQYYYLCRVDLNTGKHLDSRISGCGVENFTKMELSILGLSSIHIYNDKLYFQGAKIVGVENPRTAKHVDLGLYECDIESREIKAVNIEPGATSGFEIYCGRYLFLHFQSKLNVMDITTGKKVEITIPNRPTTYCMADDRLYLVGGNMVHTVLFSESKNSL